MMLANLLLMFAVLVMPLGMAPAAAAQHEAMAGMAMGHCSDQSSDHHSKGGISECTMACAAALPAVVSSPADRSFVAREAVRAVFANPLHGLHPETATPPPKRS
jgi:hypothetical protein